MSHPVNTGGGCDCAPCGHAHVMLQKSSSRPPVPEPSVAPECAPRCLNHLTSPHRQCRDNKGPSCPSPWIPSQLPWSRCEARRMPAHMILRTPSLEFLFRFCYWPRSTGATCKAVQASISGLRSPTTAKRCKTPIALMICSCLSVSQCV